MFSSDSSSSFDLSRPVIRTTTAIIESFPGGKSQLNIDKGTKEDTVKKGFVSTSKKRQCVDLDAIEVCDLHDNSNLYKESLRRQVTVTRTLMELNKNMVDEINKNRCEDKVVKRVGSDLDLDLVKPSKLLPSILKRKRDVNINDKGDLLKKKLKTADKDKQEDPSKSKSITEEFSSYSLVNYESTADTLDAAEDLIGDTIDSHEKVRNWLEGVSSKHSNPHARSVGDSVLQLHSKNVKFLLDKIEDLEEPFPFLSNLYQTLQLLNKRIENYLKKK